MASPIISSFLPIAQTPGGKVTITGSNFTGSTVVLFGGVAALFFRIVSDTSIEAYPTFSGSNIITVTNPSGSGTLDGFTLLLNQVRLPDLPDLGRDVQTTDLMYIWDMVATKLTKSAVSGLPFGSGGGGGGGGGNIFTALGSPFKVRTGDDNYSYDAGSNSVTITDIRLLGKSDYVVYSTEVSNEFENTQLTFDMDEGSVTIADYKLADDAHITIYADGIVTTAITDWLATQQAQLAKLLLVAAPFLPSVDSDNVLQNPGGLVAWFRPAIEIPEGWTEWIPGRSCGLRGQDPDDIYDPDTNPEALSRENGSTGGSITMPVIIQNNIPTIRLKIFNNGDSVGPLVGSDDDNANTASWQSNNALGNNDYKARRSNGSGANVGNTSAYGSDTPTAQNKPLDPYRIVNFIQSTQNA